MSCTPSANEKQYVLSTIEMNKLVVCEKNTSVIMKIVCFDFSLHLTKEYDKQNAFYAHWSAALHVMIIIHVRNIFLLKRAQVPSLILFWWKDSVMHLCLKEFPFIVARCSSWWYWERLTIFISTEEFTIIFFALGTY